VNSFSPPPTWGSAMSSLTICDTCGADCNWTVIRGDVWQWCRNCSRQLELFDGYSLTLDGEPSPQDEPSFEEEVVLWIGESLDN